MASGGAARRITSTTTVAQGARVDGGGRICVESHVVVSLAERTTAVGARGHGLLIERVAITTLDIDSVLLAGSDWDWSWKRNHAPGVSGLVTWEAG